MRLRAVRDAWSGETRVQVTILGAEKIAFAHGLGLLLQCFGWGMATLGWDLESVHGEDPALSWHQCFQTISLVEHCLRLKPMD